MTHFEITLEYFVRTCTGPEYTLCVLLQGLDTLRAYLWLLLAPLSTLYAYVWLLLAPLSTLFSSQSTLHAHLLLSFSDICTPLAHFFGSLSPRNPGSPGPCIPTCRPRGPLKSSSKHMTIHSESAPASGLAAGELGCTAGISVRSSGSAAKNVLLASNPAMR